MRWSILGRPSDLLTRLIEYDIIAYMLLPGSRGISCCRCLHQLPAGHSPSFRNHTIPWKGHLFVSCDRKHYRGSGRDCHAGHVPGHPLRAESSPVPGMVHRRRDGKRPVSPPPVWEKIRSTHAPRFLSLIGSMDSVCMGRPSAIPPCTSVYLSGQGTNRGCLLGRVLY